MVVNRRIGMAKFAKDRGYERLSPETNGMNLHLKHFESMQTCETPSVCVCLKCGFEPRPLRQLNKPKVTAISGTLARRPRTPPVRGDSGGLSKEPPVPAAKAETDDHQDHGE